MQGIVSVTTDLADATLVRNLNNDVQVVVASAALAPIPAELQLVVDGTPVDLTEWGVSVLQDNADITTDYMDPALGEDKPDPRYGEYVPYAEWLEILEAYTYNMGEAAGLFVTPGSTTLHALVNPPTGVDLDAHTIYLGVRSDVRLAYIAADAMGACGGVCEYPGSYFTPLAKSKTVNVTVGTASFALDGPATPELAAGEDVTYDLLVSGLPENLESKADLTVLVNGAPLTLQSGWTLEVQDALVADALGIQETTWVDYFAWREALDQYNGGFVLAYRVTSLPVRLTVVDAPAGPYTLEVRATRLGGEPTDLVATVSQAVTVLPATVEEEPEPEQPAEPEPVAPVEPEVVVPEEVQPEAEAPAVAPTQPAKVAQAKPAKPVLSRATATKITVNKVAGAEYSLNGKTWQNSPTFTDLKPGKAYTVQMRLKATSTKLASKASSLTVRTADAKVTVTLNANGGSKQSAKTVTANTAYGKLPTPTKNRSNFLGWYTKKVGGTKVTATTVLKSQDDVTLYAHWAKQSKYGTVVGTARAGLRTSANWSTTPDLGLARGTVVKIEGKVNRPGGSNDWYKVTVNGKTRYISTKLVDTFWK
jgi:uncharacterized repeat protein (TIGR02543 family)